MRSVYPCNPPLANPISPKSEEITLAPVRQFIPKTEV